MGDGYFSPKVVDRQLSLSSASKGRISLDLAASDPEVPELLDLVFTRRTGDVIGDQENIWLLKLDSSPVREAGVAAFGFENIASGI